MYVAGITLMVEDGKTENPENGDRSSVNDDQMLFLESIGRFANADPEFFSATECFASRESTTCLWGCGTKDGYHLQYATK